MNESSQGNLKSAGQLSVIDDSVVTENEVLTKSDVELVDQSIDLPNFTNSVEKNTTQAVEMNKNCQEELKSAGQLSLIDTSVDKKTEGKCAVTENKVVAASDVEVEAANQSTDFLIVKNSVKKTIIYIEMNASFQKELKSSGQLSVIDDSVDKNTEEKPAVTENKMVTARDVVAEAVNQSIDLSIVTNPVEKNTTQATESTTAIEDETIVRNETTTKKAQNVTASECQEEETDVDSKDKHDDHVTYTEDGTAIYTDPKTNYQYKWCTRENNWIQNDSAASANAYENEHYKWCSETQKWIPKQTQVTETEHYKWDADKNEWVAKVKETENKNFTQIVYDVDEDGQRIYTDKDGTVFFWDVEKNAWFPKIDEDFMARYQMNYGFVDNTSESEREQEKRDLEAAVEKESELAKLVEEAKASEEASKEAAKQGLKRKQQEPPKWFEMDPAHNTKVYVSNLPLDITLEEFADVMGKCGMIMRDPQNQKYKLKLYTESDGQIKGDGLCDYIKVESVDLALKILDEYNLRGHKMRVQRAQFQMRGEYNPALKPKRKKKDKEKLAKIKEKLFDWRPEKMRGERTKNEKTVIIKNLFHPELFEKEVQLILDYQNDLREECSKCGAVKKVVIYDRHSEGVAQVNMSSPEEADLVIQMMNGRFFGKRKLTADHWDGKTKYKIEETEEEINKRLNKWDKYLETDENKSSDLHKDRKEDSLTDTQKDKEDILGSGEN